MVVVLDNEAVQAVADPQHPKHRRLTAALRAARTDQARVLVPLAVRVEAAVLRDSPTTTSLGRLKVEDVPLSSPRADRAIELAVGLTASAVDATVAQCAEEHAAAGARVTVYTSDVHDLEQLCARATGRISVRRV